MWTEQFAKEESSNVWRIESLTAQYETRHLQESVYHDEIESTPFVYKVSLCEIHGEILQIAV